MSNVVESDIKKIKKAWVAGSSTVAVYGSAASGRSEYDLVYRLKDGLKELGADYRKPIKERYDAANGEGTFDIFLKSINESSKDVWSEILYYRPELSAK